MKIFFYGQSCFMFEIDRTKILFDPFISKNPKAPKTDLATVKPDFILLSHGHFDHVDDAVEIAKSSGAKVVSNPEIGTWLKKQGVDEKQVASLNLGGSMDMPFGSIQLVPAWHSSDLPDGTGGGTAGGFIVKHKDGTFYFSGDTALFQEMKLFPKRNKLDFAILCIGDHYTMGYEDAALAAEFLEVDKVLGMHFDTFPAIEIDHDKAVEAFRKVNKTLILPVPGQSVEI